MVAIKSPTLHLNHRALKVEQHQSRNSIWRFPYMVKTPFIKPSSLEYKDPIQPLYDPLQRSFDPGSNAFFCHQSPHDSSDSLWPPRISRAPYQVNATGPSLTRVGL